MLRCRWSTWLSVGATSYLTACIYFMSNWKHGPSAVVHNANAAPKQTSNTNREPTIITSDNPVAPAVAALRNHSTTRGRRHEQSRHRVLPRRAAYVLASFQDLEALGDGLRMLISTDGLHWSAIPGSPLLLPLAQIKGARVFRDPSIAWHPPFFHLVFTSDLCVDQVPGHWKCRRHGKKPRPLARFGYARSRDLVHWEGVRLVEVELKDACSLWAPEVCVFVCMYRSDAPTVERLHSAALGPTLTSTAQRLVRYTSKHHRRRAALIPT